MTQSRHAAYPREGMIDSAFIIGALTAARRQGLDVDRLLADYALDWQALQQGRGLNARDYAALLRQLWQRLDDESSGYARKPMRLGSFRMMCHASIGCRNLRRALLRVIEYFRLMSDEYQWQLLEQGEEARFQLRMVNGQDDSNISFLLLSLCIILHRWSAWMIDSPLLLSRVQFSFSRHSFDTDLSALLQAPVRFDAPVTELVMPVRYLQAPIQQSPDTLSPFLANSPEQLLTHYRKDDSLSARVRDFIDGQQELEALSQEMVASHFNISVATLGRRLKREGHQFLELKDKVRRGRAVKLLLGSELPISDIAEQLGYSEPSVFYRNFKKWVGKTPAEFRDNRG
ncbi:AraC family transcriptional regulator [Ferrimonas sp. SCSIO 43195]|uniref:AraC family transcriptional regulator n=1 Tax=Ferrimonas sp. SCSIO 43195 TaxID=2822844 RepID=UPI002074C985|nr:AraC family transcriptional regulator [Ferrimonas sp. SCSIO 43195]USD39033.1 AraC family transcriptional regulator [Ferrimonas sp. SCSIO 43195]